MHPTGPHYNHCTSKASTAPHSTLSPTALPLNLTGPPLREVTARTPQDSGILLSLMDKHPWNLLHPAHVPCDARVHPILVNPGLKPISTLTC